MQEIIKPTFSWCKARHSSGDRVVLKSVSCCVGLSEAPTKRSLDINVLVRNFRQAHFFFQVKQNGVQKCCRSDACGKTCHSTNVVA